MITGWKICQQLGVSQSCEGLHFHTQSFSENIVKNWDPDCPNCSDIKGHEIVVKQYDQNHSTEERLSSKIMLPKLIRGTFKPVRSNLKLNSIDVFYVNKTKPPHI